MPGKDSFGQIDDETEQDFAAVLPPRSRPAADPAALPVREDRPSPPSGADSVAPEATPSSRRGRRPGSTSDRLVVVAPLSVRARMRAVQIDTGRLYRDQVLDALEETVDDLPDLIGEQIAPAVIKGKLFERAATPAPGSSAGEDRCQMTIPGFTVTHLQIIDSLVDATGATGRSQVVVTALQKVLSEGSTE